MKNPSSKFLLILLFSLLFTTVLLGQEKFDLITFTAPKGWTKDASPNGDVIRFSKEDTAKNIFAMITVFKAISASADSKTNFETAWQALAKTNLNASTPQMNPADNQNGWEVQSGLAAFQKESLQGIVLLATASAENKMVNILLVTNSDIYQAEAQKFFASVKLPQLSQASEVKTPANPTKTTFNNIKYEVWMCHCYTPTGLADMKFETVIFSPDGRGLFRMPEKGLNGVTPQNSNETGSWGTVTNQSETVILNNDKYGKLSFYKISPTEMGKIINSQKSSSIYKKVKQVDGLRFEGAYSPELSYYNGKSDIISQQINPNKRPIIFFKKDGNYINEGIEFSNLTFGDNFAIGRGTYEIANYSLILTTQSGRKLQVAFSPVLDANPAAADNGGFLINNNLFYRLGKDFVPHN